MEWYINTTQSTAEYSKDFLADGATLKFTPGQTRGCKATVIHVYMYCLYSTSISQTNDDFV